MKFETNVIWKDHQFGIVETLIAIQQFTPIQTSLTQVGTITNV